jgi:hypothetical protein
MTPSNWASLLDTSFTGVDLLDSPYVLSQRMSQLTNQKINLQAQIDQITAVIPEDAELKKLTDDYYNSKQKLSDAETKLTGTYMNGGALVFKTALNIAGAAGKLPDGLAKRFGESIDAGKQPGGSLDDFVTKLTTAIEDGQKAQQALIDASQKLSDAQAAYISEKNLSTLGPLLTPLRADMQKLDAEIKDLADKIQISGSISGNTNTTSPPPPTPPTPPPPPDANQIAPNKIPPGFMQIVMDQESSTMKTETKKSSTAQNSSYGATFFFGGYQHSDSHSSSAFSSFTKDEKCKIQVGLAVAKVAIERDWFNPGVFALTDDMCNVTTSRISPNKVYRGFDDARFEAMRGSSSHTNIFPCFPTAFVVARDITIRITTENSFSHHDASSVEDHASSGGGFLCFSGSSSSSSSSSASSAHVSANANTITIRMTDPQIIGYYIEAVPPDNSVMIDQVIEQETSAGFVTVEDFVKDYRKVLTGYADSVKENSADKSMKGGGAA